MTDKFELEGYNHYELRELKNIVNFIYMQNDIIRTMDTLLEDINKALEVI